MTEATRETKKIEPNSFIPSSSLRSSKLLTPVVEVDDSALPLFILGRHDHLLDDAVVVSFSARAELFELFNDACEGDLGLAPSDLAGGIYAAQDYLVGPAVVEDF